MTDIEKRALELVNAELSKAGCIPLNAFPRGTAFYDAFYKAVEAHEADKSRHAAELREQAERFSEAAKEAVRLFLIGRDRPATEVLSPFILAKPDPLEDVLSEAGYAVFPDDIERLRAALDARGLAIVKKEAVNG